MEICNNLLTFLKNIFLYISKNSSLTSSNFNAPTCEKYVSGYDAYCIFV